MSQLTERYLKNLVKAINEGFKGIEISHGVLSDGRGSTEVDVKAEFAQPRQSGVSMSSSERLVLTVGDRRCEFDEQGYLVQNVSNIDPGTACSDGHHRWAPNVEVCNCGKVRDVSRQIKEANKPKPAPMMLTDAQAQQVMKTHPLLWAGFCRGSVTEQELWAAYSHPSEAQR